MGPNSQFGSSCGSTQHRTIATGLTIPKTHTIAIGPVLPPKIWHFNLTTLAPIKYLSSDDIVTWSIHRLCSVSRSFTAHIPIYDPTNVHWVTIENQWISPKILLCSTVIQPILVGSQIWKREVRELRKLHNLCIQHVTIRSQPQNWISASIVEIIKWNWGLVPTWPKTCGFISGPGSNPALQTQSQFLGGSGPGPGPLVWFQPRLLPANPEPLQTLNVRSFLQWQYWINR